MHGELSGKAMLPMHWGTFNLAFHAWDEPAERTFAAAGAARLLTPVPGERIEPAACAPLVARRGLGSALTKGWGFAERSRRGAGARSDWPSGHERRETHAPAARRAAHAFGCFRDALLRCPNRASRLGWVAFWPRIRCVERLDRATGHALRHSPAACGPKLQQNLHPLLRADPSQAWLGGLARPGRGALHQRPVDLDRHRPRRLAVRRHVDQGLGGPPAHLVIGQDQGGQRRARIARQLLVVIAHHREVARDRQTELRRRFERADRHQVVGGEDRRRRVLRAQQFQRVLVAA